MGRIRRALSAAGVAAVVGYAGNRITRPDPDASTRSRWIRVNHAGHRVTLAEGPVAVVAVLAGGLVAGGGRTALAGSLAALGSGLVGAYDDLAGSAQARGFRGHLHALRRGTVTTGLIKIVGVGLSGALAAVLLPRPGPALVDRAIDTALIAGTANLVNLFDLRPGRAAKVVLLLGAPLVGAGTAPALGASIGCLPADLAARSMLGDCGANALGASVATAAAAALPRTPRLIALIAVVGLTLASEKFSFTRVIAAHPVLDRLDRLGRA